MVLGHVWQLALGYFYCDIVNGVFLWQHKSFFLYQRDAVWLVFDGSS